MIVSKDESVLVDGVINDVGLRKDLPDFTREMFRILDTLAHGIGKHATNEALLVSFVLMPMKIKIEQMLKESDACAIAGKPDAAKAKRIYQQILNGEDIDFTDGIW